MICRAIVALLAVGIVAAQQEFNFTTKGRGGELCGEYHRCLFESRCLKDDKTRNNMCVCPELYEGNGKLGCHLLDDPTVYVQADPHVKNFYREFASLPTPCLYRLVRLNYTDVERNILGFVELYGENMLFKNGEYYLTKLILKTEIHFGTDIMKQAMQFYGDVNFDGYSYNYTAKSLDIVDESVTLLLEDERVRTDYLGYTMNVGVNDTNNLLNVTIRELGITLLFRPPSLLHKLDNTRLPFVPGAVFIVNKEYFERVYIDKNDYEISSWPQGPSLEEVAKELKMNQPLYVHYLMLNNTLVQPIYDEVCYQTSDIFINECRLDEVRILMLENCTTIYKDKKFLQCLIEKHPVEEVLPLQKEFFQRCEISYCRKDKHECELMKEELLTRSECDLPEILDRLDCADMDILPTLEDKRPVEPEIEVPYVERTLPPY